MNNVVLERWKDIQEYEGLYLISDIGRVLSISRKRKNSSDGYYTTQTKMLKQTKTTTGYHKVELYK